MGDCATDGHVFDPNTGICGDCDLVDLPRRRLSAELDGLWRLAQLGEPRQDG